MAASKGAERVPGSRYPEYAVAPSKARNVAAHLDFAGRLERGESFPDLDAETRAAWIAQATAAAERCK